MTPISRSSICCSLLLSAYSPAIGAADPEPLNADLPIVLTPTRLRQSLAEVPASVTVITADMISKFGVKTIPDILRLVPGMAVTQVTGPDYRISYHGTTIRSPRRMNVLVDGVSVYRPAFARIDWDQLPVAIEDIERIEVTRGPNSATYGANSMLAIVNIITKHPRDVGTGTLAATVGSQDTLQATARYAGQLGNSTSYRITFNHQTDSGFDDASTLGGGHDGHRFNKLNFRSITELGADQSLDLQATIQQGGREVAFADRFQKTLPDVTSDDYYLNARWLKQFSPQHDLAIQAYVTHHAFEQRWTTCPPTATLLPEMFALWRANPAYANALLARRIPTGGSAQDDALAQAGLAAITALGARAAAPTCVLANQDYDETRLDAELQDTLVLSDAFRVVSGIGLRRDRADSDTFLNGRVVNDSWRLFANGEYKLTPKLLINAGGFLEKDELTRSSFSPRLALNAHLTKNHMLRFVVSKAVRTPDILEQRASTVYRTTNWDPPLNGVSSGVFYQSVSSPGNLNPEKILSREIGYLGNFPQYGLLLDAKVFDDKLTDLISEKYQVAEFAPTNNNSARLRGAELQLSYRPSDRWLLYLAYGYLDNEPSTIDEQTQYARHSGALGLSLLLPKQWRASFAYYGYGASSAGQSRYGREDLSLSKLFKLGEGMKLTTSFTIQHLDNRSSTFLVDDNQVRESRYDDAMHYFFSVELGF
jgi:iron complex outermembrane recepter protein